MQERSNTLTASFENVPAEHDGENTFTFDVGFAEDVGVGYQTMRDDAFSVNAGNVTRARRVDGRNDRWEITVEPDSRETVTIRLPGERMRHDRSRLHGRRRPATTEQQPLSDRGGHAKHASDGGLQRHAAEHTGDSFTFGLAFSEDFGLS